MKHLEEDVIEQESINERNIALLRENFPGVIEENIDGSFSVNARKLQLLIDPKNATIEEDGFELSWVGKKEAYHTAFARNTKILKPLKDESKDFDTTENILIKGDNLDALRILKNNYYEAIKMIYIDPPYNTTSENFIYRDNFTKSLEETMEELGYDAENIDYIKNIQGARTHSGWLSFMYPRLLLARDLLDDDGVIFISIDDNEQANLKVLCDGVFGENCFVAQFPWRKRTAKSDVPFGVSQDYEWLLCYAKNDFLAGILHKRKYYYTDDFPNDGWRLSDLTTQRSSKERENSAFDMKDPKTGKLYPFNPKRVWGVSNDTFQDYYDKGKIVFPDDYDFLNISIPAYRVFESEDRAKALKKYGSEEAIKAISTHFPANIGRTEDGNQEMVELFGSKLFPFPKPTSLLQHLIETSTSDNDIILDFFAGSGTCGHSTLLANTQDNESRRFILIQIPEVIDPKKEAYTFVKETLKKTAPTIFEITAERLRRAGEKVKNDNKDKEGIDSLDVGFRVFEVVEDERQTIYKKSLAEATQEDLDLFTNPKMEDIDTILYNLLVAEKLPLSTKIEPLKENALYVARNVAFIVGDIELEEAYTLLETRKGVEYITIYSPLVKKDKFTLEAVNEFGRLGLSSDKMRFRG